MSALLLGQQQRSMCSVHIHMQQLPATVTAAACSAAQTLHVSPANAVCSQTGTASVRCLGAGWGGSRTIYRRLQLQPGLHLQGNGFLAVKNTCTSSELAHQCESCCTSRKRMRPKHTLLCGYSGIQPAHIYLCTPCSAESRQPKQRTSSLQDLTNAADRATAAAQLPWRVLQTRVCLRASGIVLEQLQTEPI